MKKLRKILPWSLAALCLALLLARLGGATALGFQHPPSPPPNPAIVSVKAYGAVGDGVTDDRVAIANALTAACGSSIQELFFPPGTYMLSRSGSSAFALDLPCGNVVLSGVQGKSILKLQPLGTIAAVAMIRVNQLKSVTIRDLVFDGGWGNCVTRITSASNGVALSSAGTINVSDASCFPAGTFPAVAADTAGGEYLTCTGKTTTTLTGCTTSGSTGTLFAGQQIGYINSNVGINQATDVNTAGHTTTVTAGSNGQVLSGTPATINVVDTTGFGFTSGDQIWFKTSLGFQLVTCTGSTATTFTGCTLYVTTQGGTLATGNEASNSIDPQKHAIMLRGAENVTIDHVDFRNVYGDCVWIGSGASGGVDNNSRNVRVLASSCKVAARSGIAFTGGVSDVSISDFYTENIYGQAIDGEPVTAPVRDIRVARSTLDGWYERELHGGGNPLSIVGGKTFTWATASDSARSWRVTDNVIRGTVFIERSTDAVFSRNRVVLDFANPSHAILAEMGSNHLEITDNFVYARASCDTCAEGAANTAAIVVWTYQSGSQRLEPTNVVVSGNKIEARNGRDGILIKGAGGVIEGDTGTATTIGNTTLADSGKAWTTDQWVGFVVRRGAVQAQVESNNTTTLTLGPSSIPQTASGACSGLVSSTCSAAWVDGLGNQATTPSTGTYQIYRPTGVVDVVNNTIDLTDDGRGGGRWGIDLTAGGANAYGMRVRVRGNKIRNCTTYAIRTKSGGNPFPLVDISDNFAWDDQNTHTCTNLVRFENAMSATKFIMGGNVVGEGVTNATSNLSAGTWIVRDGAWQQWAGFGSPEGVVTAAIGSTYQRLDGSGVTASYAKTSGSGNTGWLPAGGAVQAVATANGLSVTGTTNPTLSVFGLAGAGANTLATADGVGGLAWSSSATLSSATLTGALQMKGSTPALTSCGSGPTVAGGKYSFTITTGTGATACTATYATALTASPTCTVTPENGTITAVTVSNTAVTLGAGTAASAKYHVQCDGHD